MATIVHEISDSSNGYRHRIVIDNVPGEWARYEFIAQLGDYRAAIVEYWDDMFPPGVFICTPVEAISRRSSGFTG